jgi:hypothetical protein
MNYLSALKHIINKANPSFETTFVDTNPWYQSVRQTLTKKFVAHAQKNAIPLHQSSVEITLDMLHDFVDHLLKRNVKIINISPERLFCIAHIW